MKYAPRLYAQAFTDLAIQAKNADEREMLVKNLVQATTKHGDERTLPRIATLAQKLLVKRNGASTWRIETARPQKATPGEILHGLAGKDDLIETEVRPELVAGLRLTQNDEREYDASLATKLKKLFAHL